VEIRGWKTSFLFVQGNKYLFATNYSLNDFTYDTLGVFLNNKPLSYDEGGSTFIYIKKHGIVKTSEYSDWTDEGQIWNRVN